jgi:opacity protein-like surface antigen
MRRPIQLLLFATVAALALPPAVAAQVLERPRRPFVGVFGGGPAPDPTRVRQEMTLTVNLLGGYDDNLSITDVDSGRPPDPNQDTAGYLGTGDVSLRYWRGTTLKSFEIEGRGYLNSYSNTDVGAIHGGSIRLGGNTPWGRRLTLHFDQRFNVDPLYTLGGGFAPLRDAIGGGPALPASNNTSAGLFVRDSWSSDSMISADRALGRRDVLTGSYSFDTRRYSDDQGGSSWAHRASATYAKNFDRSLSLRSTYTYGNTTIEEVLNQNTFERPIEEHTIDVGPSYLKRVSRTRQMLVSASIGATHIDTLSSTTSQPLKYWAPYGSAQARLDLGRSWALWGDYRRGMTVLDGLTIQTYFTDSARLNAGGLAASRVELVFTGGIANGRAPRGSNSNSQFNTYLVAMQAQWAISRYLAAVVNYSYFDYKFTDTPDLPAGFQSTFARNSVRFGLRLWTPLVGRYVDHATGAGTPTTTPH